MLSRQLYVNVEQVSAEFRQHMRVERYCPARLIVLVELQHHYKSYRADGPLYPLPRPVLGVVTL